MFFFFFFSNYSSVGKYVIIVVGERTVAEKTNRRRRRRRDDGRKNGGTRGGRGGGCVPRGRVKTRRINRPRSHRSPRWPACFDTASAADVDKWRGGGTDDVELVTAENKTSRRAPNGRRVPDGGDVSSRRGARNEEKKPRRDSVSGFVRGIKDARPPLQNESCKSSRFRTQNKRPTRLNTGEILVTRDQSLFVYGSRFRSQTMADRGRRETGRQWK